MQALAVTLADIKNAQARIKGRVRHTPILQDMDLSARFGVPVYLKQEYKQDTGAGLYRRSLYTFWRRTTTPPNMMIFDTTTRDVCAARRQVTNTPLQPLVMLNDPQFVEAARKLGERILKNGGSSDESRAQWAYREVTGKAPTSQQLPLLLDLITEQREFFKTKSSDATALLKVGESKADASLDPTDSATFAMLAQALLNLDAFITER